MKVRDSYNIHKNIRNKEDNNDQDVGIESGQGFVPPFLTARIKRIWNDSIVDNRRIKTTVDIAPHKTLH